MQTQDPSGRPSPGTSDGGGGQPAAGTEPSTEQSTLRERLADAVRILSDHSTRWMVIGATVAFPVVMLLGGVLTTFSDSFVVQLLAVLPALLLLGMVGAFGKYVLAVGMQGLADADDPPKPSQLVQQAPGVLLRLAALGATFLGPGLLVALLVQMPFGLVVLFGGLLLLPMATALLLGTGDWRAMSPRPLIAVMRRASPATIADASVTAGLFVPALVAFLLTLGQPAHTTLAVVGPLAAAPALLAARMIGLTLYEHRHQLAGLFPMPAVDEFATVRTLTKPAARQALARPAAPAALKRTRARPAAHAARTPLAGTAVRSAPANHTPLARTQAQPPTARPAPATAATQPVRPTAPARRPQAGG
jgi:hypothetical protein